MKYDGFVEKTNKDSNFIPKIRWGNKKNENKKIMDIVPGFPVNKRMKYDRAKMTKAIQHGMVIMILFRGTTGKSKDKWMGGRERIILPLVLGINKNTRNELVRGWHLEGYSVSQKKQAKKVWRLFKTSGIKSMMFTGHFYRLPPKGYKMNDRTMTERTIARADFNSIRRNQEKLIKSGKIENEEKVKMQEPKRATTSKIQIKNSGTMLDLKNPWDNELIKDNKRNAGDVKVSIMKTVFSNEYLAILGALGEPGKTVRLYEGKDLLGSYKTVTSFTGDEFNKNRIVKGVSEFDLYVFEKKL